MTAFFVDTAIFVAAFNRRDRNHQKGLKLLKEAFQKAKVLYTSDYVLDETISLAWARTKNREIVLKLDELIQDSGKIDMIPVDSSTLSSAKSCLRKYGQALSLTDWTSAVLMRDRKIPHVLSFDVDFDRVKSIKGFSFITRLETISEPSS